ncbi:MAG TPA: DUF1559 domain-containing protein [Gemmataceae bacterium]|nr:DUF1559 domain-containing protein [Gemmataceae bacterium]
MIEFRCTCGKLLKAREELIGRLTQCPACGKEFAVPSTSAAEEAAGSSHEERELDRGHAPRPTRKSGRALIALILGIASLPLLFFAGIPAIIFGILGIRDVTHGRGQVDGMGMAVTGIVLGAVGTLLTFPAVAIVGLLMPAMQKVNATAQRMQSANHLRQVAIAMHNYHDTHGSFPPAVVRGKDGKALYSWRVLLLPYLDQDALSKQFKLDEPWDSPNNIKLLSQMPDVFREPAASNADPTMTFYQVFVGPKTAFESPRGENVTSFTDGTTSTFLVVEAGTGVPWTKPADLAYDAKAPLPTLGGHHATGFNAAFADGSVHLIQNNVTEAELRAFITRNGGEKAQPP